LTGVPSVETGVEGITLGGDGFSNTVKLREEEVYRENHKTVEITGIK